MWCLGQSVLHTLLLLSTVSFSVHHVQCGRAVILTGPEDQIAAPGEIVYFNCHARGDSVYWRIDYNYPHPDDAARGITYTYNEIPRPINELEEHNNTVTMEARPENNNTLVSCVATGQVSNQYARREGRLIIAGPPLPPSVNYDMEYAGNDTVSFIFSWNESYTWSGFPVTRYTYKMINQSSGEIVYSNISQNGTSQYGFNTSGNSCYKLTFSISANNSLGRGNWSDTLIGHPLIIGELGEIETLITFHVNGSPHFWISFLAPNICPEYQTGTYRIIISSGDSGGDDIVYDFGSTVYHQRIEGVRELITKELRTGLNVSEMYVVTVSVESIGVTHSRNKTFYTNFTAACQCTATIDEMGPTCSPTEAGSSVGVIIGAVIVIIIIGILIAVIIIMAFLLAQKRKLSRDEPDGQQLIGLPNKNSRRAQASNPIYEGATYETTPGESFRSLDSLNEPRRSATSSADLTLHYVDVPPNLPPPRGADKQLLSEPVDEIAAIKASIKEAQLQLSVPHQTVEEEYIVMGSKHSNGHVKRSVDKELMMDGEEKYVALDSLR